MAPVRRPPRLPPRFEEGDPVAVAGDAQLLFVVVAAPVDRTGNHVVRPAAGGPPRVVPYAELIPLRPARVRRPIPVPPGQLPIWPCVLAPHDTV